MAKKSKYSWIDEVESFGIRVSGSVKYVWGYPAINVKWNGGSYALPIDIIREANTMGEELEFVE